jgi:hypothetical protein
MSAEYRPVSNLAFHTIDDRLEKHGIKVEFGGAVTKLVGPFGVLFATLEGNSTHFERALGVETQAVVDAIEKEYGIEIIDENDHRFWGFASHDDLLEAYCRPDRDSKISPRNLVLVEGPSIGDAEFAKQWTEGALKADAVLEAYFQENPGFREKLHRIETVALVKFAPCVMAFVRMWLQQQGVFSIDLFDSEDADLFSVMAAMGFFSRTGERYQMTIPQTVDISAILHALLRLAGTEDEHSFLHPESLLVTLTAAEAETWKCRLNSIHWRQRLADRELLLNG